MPEEQQSRIVEESKETIVEPEVNDAIKEEVKE